MSSSWVWRQQTEGKRVWKTDQSDQSACVFVDENTGEGWIERIKGKCSLYLKILTTYNILLIISFMLLLESWFCIAHRIDLKWEYIKSLERLSEEALFWSPSLLPVPRGYESLMNDSHILIFSLKKKKKNL